MRPRAPIAPVETRALLERSDRGDFPATLYVEGQDETLKAALLAELRRAWARHCPESPAARVFRAAESGVDQILAAYHGGSLFTSRELTLVLEVEDLGRSEKKIQALAEGLPRPAGGSCLVLVESEADAPRKSLEPLRIACAARWVAVPLGHAGQIAWGARRLEHERVSAGPGVLEAIAQACEGDSAAFFNELEKLLGWAGPGGNLAYDDAVRLLRPVVGADLPEFLSAVAVGDAALAGQRLSRLLATGVGEGTVLFALSNLIGGSLGGWARYRELSETLRRRCSPRALARALDGVYRAEAAWKRGRADAVVVLEQATRAACAAAGSSATP